MIFKDRLKALRTDNDLTQLELAKRIHVTRQAISNYENQVSEPNNSMLILLADFFDCSTDYLLGRTNIPYPYPARKHK